MSVSIRFVDAFGRSLACELGVVVAVVFESIDVESVSACVGGGNETELQQPVLLPSRGVRSAGEVGGESSE